MNHKQFLQWRLGKRLEFLEKIIDLLYGFQDVTNSTEIGLYDRYYQEQEALMTGKLTVKGVRVIAVKEE